MKLIIIILLIALVCLIGWQKTERKNEERLEKLRQMAAETEKKREQESRERMKKAYALVQAAAAASHAAKAQEASALKQAAAAAPHTANAQELSGSISDEALIGIFTKYFSPNKSFYSEPGSPKFTSYFNAINAAKLEMLNNPALYEDATGRSPAELAEMMNDPKPVITNMTICGLIFRMGEFAVTRSVLICVDFSELIPNCVALYLLLTAEREPEEKRKQLIDAGDGTDKRPLNTAIMGLQPLDPAWQCEIL